eukprot:g26016.t1
MIILIIQPGPGRPHSLPSCRLLSCLGWPRPTRQSRTARRHPRDATLSQHFIIPGRRQGFKCFTLPRSFVELSLGTEAWNQLFLPICDSQLFVD